jgi:hypothetical protein
MEMLGGKIQLKMKKPAKKLAFIESWCPGEDSNLHNLAITRT